MPTLIMKFGGSTVGTAAALTQVLAIIMHQYKNWERLVLIASALDGVTDMLLEAAHLAQVSNQRGYRRIAATLRTRHMALIEQLPLGPTERTALQADVDRLLFEMLDLCQAVSNTPSDSLSPSTSDQIISVGERLSARIIAALLRQNGLRGVAIDGTDIIVTDNVYGNATPLIEMTRQRIQQHLIPMLERQIIPVVTGFIGRSENGQTTTMGRGGSDYTASMLSLCTDASEVWIWSDVDGMMSTDPREVEDAQVIPQLSYSEVAELAYFGARILHPRMIQPLREHQIPIWIKNVYKPQQTGTLITDQEIDDSNPIKAVTMIQGIGMRSNRSGSLIEVIKVVDEVLFQSIGSHADVMLSSQSSASTYLCFIIPTSAGVEVVDSICTTLNDKLIHLRDGGRWQVEPVHVITVVGQHLDQKLDIMGKILSLLTNFRLRALAQGPSHCSLSLVVPPQDADTILRRIHNLIIRND